MAAISITDGDEFLVTVHKSLVAAPDRIWVNTYELRAFSDDADGTAWTPFCAAIVLYEQAIHLNTVSIDKVTVSTWQPDSNPYDPSKFFTLEFNAVGTLTHSGTDVLSLEHTLNVTRQAHSGRNGKLMYRGCLTEGDIDTVAGKSFLVDKDTWSTTLANAITSSDLNLYIGSAATELRLMMISHHGEAREVAGLEVKGCGIRKLSRRNKKRATPVV